MKRTLNAGRVVALLIVTVLLGVSRSSAQVDPNKKGIGRGGDGTPVSIMVTLKGKAVSGASVTVKSDSGVPVDSGTTSATGRFGDNLDAGDYAVTVMKGEQTMTQTVHVAKSKKTMVVRMKLDAPAPPAPPAPPKA